MFNAVLHMVSSMKSMLVKVGEAQTARMELLKLTVGRKKSLLCIAFCAAMANISSEAIIASNVIPDEISSSTLHCAESRLRFTQQINAGSRVSPLFFDTELVTLQLFLAAVGQKVIEIKDMFCSLFVQPHNAFQRNG